MTPFVEQPLEERKKTEEKMKEGEEKRMRGEKDERWRLGDEERRRGGEGERRRGGEEETPDSLALVHSPIQCVLIYNEPNLATILLNVSEM